MAAHVELAPTAERDLKRVGPGPDRKAVIDALTVGLTAIPPPENLDIKALKGALPWLRLRVGDYRILYRPLSLFELQALELGRRSEIRVKKMQELYKQGKLEELGELLELGPPGEYGTTGFLIARIVHRRDLDRAVRTLPI